MTETMAWREVARTINDGAESYLCLAVADVYERGLIDWATLYVMRRRIDAYRRAPGAACFGRGRNIQRPCRVLAALWLSAESEASAT